MKKQMHVYYSGRVQGVGFRYTTEDIANELSVSGWVKNLKDGRVELVAEAEESVLNNFLAKINKTFASYINHKDISWVEATAEYKDFKIRF